ncbi:hypothetical protein I4F81_003821 [Pyropia yezoensis]|uniref:Uncharacterized protein n=1 Tax=Pyropia yezoensis TaxID=2788 RepID=A0ACC3BUN8_PYRYE|nr:hypothetical protein I4F81_003821 [Neopyropia yezoensis]
MRARLRRAYGPVRTRFRRAYGPMRARLRRPNGPMRGWGMSPSRCQPHWQPGLLRLPRVTAGSLRLGGGRRTLSASLGRPRGALPRGAAGLAPPCLPLCGGVPRGLAGRRRVAGGGGFGWRGGCLCSPSGWWRGGCGFPGGGRPGVGRSTCWRALWSCVRCWRVWRGGWGGWARRGGVGRGRPRGCRPRRCCRRCLWCCVCAGCCRAVWRCGPRCWRGRDLARRWVRQRPGLRGAGRCLCCVWGGWGGGGSGSRWRSARWTGWSGSRST